MTGVIVSVQIGLPQTYDQDSRSRAWTSGIAKSPVSHAVYVGRTNIVGDGQADLKHHGGADKAILAYAAAHYPGWREELGLEIAAFPHGAFGENFTIDGLAEPNVCIGDVWATGDGVRLQISQPRQPCWKLARRWQTRDLVSRVEHTGRTGWYLRVVTEGHVQPGDAFALIERPFPKWTVERANAVMSGRARCRDDAAELAAVPLLLASWRTTLEKIAITGSRGDQRSRTLGPTFPTDG